MKVFPWSKSDKTIARKAFEAAYDRECADVVAELRTRVNTLQDNKDVWAINDFLYKRRQEMDRKYDFRYSVLLEVLAVLIHEGTITLEDVEGLDKEKLDHIKTYLMIFG